VPTVLEKNLRETGHISFSNESQLVGCLPDSLDPSVRIEIVYGNGYVSK